MSEAPYFDAHTHVHFAAFKDDYRDAVQRARSAGVRMVTVGTQRDTSRRAIEVAHEFPLDVWATVGLHPIHTEASYHDNQELGGGETAKAFSGRGEMLDYDAYKQLAQDPKVVAIGECGLDYYRLSDGTKNKQMEALDLQIALAHEVKKPLMIHCRNAFDDLVPFLARRKNVLNDLPGIIHFMSGSPEHARMLLDLGFAFTFGGVITFTRDYDATIGAIPLEHILSETDAPYVAPAPYRGKRNEPAYVVEVVKKLAALKHVSEEVMRERIWETGKRIYRIA